MAAGIASSLEIAYRAAHQQALVVTHDEPGIVLLTGRDRLDLLNRMSTNDLAELPAGTWKRTILTNALARVVDVVSVFSRRSELLLLTSPGAAANVLAWLSGYIFFQDDIQVSLPDIPFSHWGIYGPKATAQLSQAGLSMVPGPVGTFVDGEQGLFWTIDQPAPGGLQLLLTGHSALSAQQAWSDAGGPVPRQAFEILRIESGLPRSGYEITDEVIPLEVGLWGDISFSKGCFIGQEILARMESRGQVARRLILVKLSDSAPHGSSLVRQGRNIGQLTSVARSPRSGWIGLAIVKAAALADDDFAAEIDGVSVTILDPLSSRQTHQPGVS